MNTRQNQSPSFGSFITGQYIPNVKCFERDWRTVKSFLRIHVFPLLATRLIGQIDLTGIISVVCRMQEAGHSSGSINRVLAVLRRAFNLALKWQVCGVSGNPVSGLSVGPISCVAGFFRSKKPIGSSPRSKQMRTGSLPMPSCCSC